MRPLLPLILTFALAASPATSAAGDFAPSPRQPFTGFTGINPPRADVPVGALWIDGYGPSGAGASADNLETVRSLSSLSIDKNLQLALTLGILNLLGVDPRARDHYTAHFSDLSIVRVKDVDRLPGPKGEPRIIEALKAGSVSVTSDTEIGLSGEKTGWQSLTGSTSNDRTRSYAIEAHDMFIALHVETPEIARGPDREIRLGEDSKSARIDDFLLVLSRARCVAAAPCVPAAGIAKINSQTVGQVDAVQLEAGGETKLKLPVPVADGRGGLFDTLAVRWLPARSRQVEEGCAKQATILVHYEGTRLTDFSAIRAKGW